MEDSNGRSLSTRRTKAIVCAVAIRILGGATPCLGQTSGAAFLMIPSSPRAYSLGQSEAISALGAQAIGANPANMGLMKHDYELFTSFAATIGGAQYGHFAAAFSTPNLGPVNSLGLAVTRLQIGGLQGADASGSYTGTSFGASDTALAFAASGSLTQDLRFGVTAKGIQSQISSYSSNWALAGDAGLTYTFSQFSKPLSIGLSVINVGQGLKFAGQTDPLPTSINAGVAAPLGPVMAVFEINHWIYNEVTEAGLGVEYALGPVAFRAGYLAQNAPQQNLALKDQSVTAQALGGLTFGLGVNAGPVQLDYSVAQQAVDYGMTQRVGLTIKWGKPEHRSDVAMKRTSARESSEWLIPGEYGIFVH